MENSQNLIQMATALSLGLVVKLMLLLMHKLRKRVHKMKNFYDDNQKKGAAFEATPAKPLNAHNTSKNNQHKICLLALADSPKSTIDLRHVYGIMQPAPRIKELRDMGYKIDTVRIDGYTPDNIKHHAVAKYVLTQLQPIVSEVV